ncbi:RNA-splicing ligase RtcB [Candidatus Wolfebacteria bacterium CG18_big_fil_WC_8_21_14_2_50_39_7]|uniref:tRNA-splicing ligase RtcB n=5 Tax=Candidatus Wolfeibacteriota TaxID=1752735 RepID=A0A2M7Q6E2_9BACT|nr:RtcB family protein [Parcubacteria group bacterium]NCP58273.1 RtcB family protein [Candidatus Wolfebacteria bacterium]OIO65884.1 MAG: RNA-splicing ligase RtcB [Candidatus Wolfebacteria bacterium CG1_02_39_135]PIP92138.1 MAG: RNA-splicing ligase RtcB [Candidatus Wolfebacteria bacterium CG18_big_fil_WC_8_21_14_2_50_39_7]PIU98861.1 MAG: RNA-splicing ligase RtcB [Candidatus Wolfebacteria bacterium CG03_land_8_20_14_0_80_39_317]PIY58943.1 MAG: RNA-splicing ligase RtcB [Candidatus Wolfebacteria b
MKKEEFKRLNDYLWEISQSFRSDMKVPARIYATKKMLEETEPDAIEQVINVATLPGIVDYSLAMPDIHTGYGFVIGGVAAFRVSDGVISPGGIGFDINCGIRLLKSNLLADEIKQKIDELATEIQRQVPSGLGRSHKVKLGINELDKILEGGAQELVRQGYGEKEDIENCEANGRLEWTDASVVSLTAKNRGRDQVGTLGSGNHFCEVQRVEEIFDERVAKVFGLFKNQTIIMIHTGSRGLGHQIATDYLRIMVQTVQKYGIQIPDRQLAVCPFNSIEGQKYFKAMAAGANFAWANRQMITHYIRQSWENVFGNENLDVLYDVAHNIAKLEGNLLVHRKGATRAFPANHPEIPEKYRSVGQPVLIPGSMGTASYILHGTEEAKESFYSTCHGAGRTMSRHAATRALSGQEIVRNLENKGIIVKCYSWRGIAEEAPQAYKNIDEVVEVVHRAGLSKKVAKLIPLAVIKGE